MNSETSSILLSGMTRRVYSRVVIGIIIFGICTPAFVQHSFAEEGGDVFGDSEPADFSGAPSSGGSYRAPAPSPISSDAPRVDSLNPDTPAGFAKASPAMPSSDSIYVARYLPNILQGAKGPADMVFLIYEYLMGLVGIVAVGVIMYGGVLRTVSADPSKIRQSNDYIKNALKGIVLLFGAQVLFNTINPNIVDIDRIQRTLQPDKKIVAGPLNNTKVGFDEPETLSPGSWEAGGTTGATEVRSRFSAVSGVTLAPECAPGGSTKGCISLKGVQNGTLDSIAAMAASGIPVRITSVTEGQHASGNYSHANGYKWDMAAIDPKFFADRPDQFEKIATRSDSSATYRDKRTDTECSLEKAAPVHWDCSAKPGGSW